MTFSDHTPHNNDDNQDEHVHGEHCNHEHDDGEHEATIVEVTEILDDGSEGETFIFEKIDSFEMDDQEYALMLLHDPVEEAHQEANNTNGNGNGAKSPVDKALEDDDEGNVFVMKVVPEENDAGIMVETYEQLEEDELEKVVSHLEKMADEDGAFDDDDDVVLDMSALLEASIREAKAKEEGADKKEDAE